MRPYLKRLLSKSSNKKPIFAKILVAFVAPYETIDVLEKSNVDESKIDNTLSDLSIEK